MSNKTLTIAVKQEIPLSRISDLLCSAFEGGSNYWYQIVAKQEPVKFEFRSDADNIYPHLDYPLNPGGYLTITTLEGDTHKGKKEWRLDRLAVTEGMAAMAALKPGNGGHHYPDFLAENDDATTGDVFLQCCLFGEVIYG